MTTKGNVIEFHADNNATRRTRARVIVANARPRPRLLSAFLLGLFVTGAMLMIGALLGWGSASGQSFDATPMPIIVDAPAEAGSGVGTTGPDAAPAPHEQLHDPIKEPVETVRDLRDAMKVSWIALLAALVFLLCKVAGYAKGWIKWFAEGWRPVLIGVLSTVAGGVYDVAILGGTGVAILVALVVNIASAIPNKGPKAASTATP